MLSAIAAVIRRDLRLAMRQGLDSLMAVVFFVLACVLFPFGVGPEPETLARIAPGVLWVAALLATLLSLDRLFQSDYDDGTLELLALSPLPMTLVVARQGRRPLAGLRRAAALRRRRVLALLLHLQARALPALLAALLVGTSGAQSDRRSRRGVGAWRAAERCSAGAADPSALHSGADLRRRRGRRGRNRAFLSGRTCAILAGLSLAAVVLAPPAAAAALRDALK